MNRYSLLTLGLLLALPLSAHAQLDKHEQSIANHGYSFPITTYDTPVLAQPGSTLRDDIEQGIKPPVAPATPAYQETETTPTLPPAMPPAIDLQSDVDQMTEKKTLTEPVSALQDKRAADQDLNALAAKALGQGDKAKDFSLPNAAGGSVNLYTELAKGPVVLVWYRGGWCPYCNLQLKSFQDKLDTIMAAGAQLIAVSPELPDNSMTTAQKNNLSYHVLSDLSNAAAREYGLVYTAPDDLKEKLPDLDLKKHNGSQTREIPLTATYVIDTDGTIAYSLITPDYRIRAQPADVITVLGDINARESIKQSRIRQALERETDKVDLKNKAVNEPMVTLSDDIQKTEDAIGKKIDQLEKESSRIEKLSDTTTIKPAIDLKDPVDLKPMVTPPPEGVEPKTTLEVRAEEGLVPETF